MFIHARPALSKRAMLAALSLQPDTSKLYARNTLQYTVKGETFTKLHDTVILRVAADGIHFSINTGGFNTVTTRERLNRALPKGWHVYTSKGVIHLRRGDYMEGKSYPFTQSISFEAGQVVSDQIETDSTKDFRLIDAYMRKIKRDGFPNPSAGDPFVWPDAQTGKYSAHYVRAWLEESYIFGTLVCHALMFAGVRKEHLGIHLSDHLRNDAMTHRRIRRYIRACLGYAS